MTTMICSNCGRMGIYWKNLGSASLMPWTYCPHCGGRNCQEPEPMEVEEKMNQIPEEGEKR